MIDRQDLLKLLLMVFLTPLLGGYGYVLIEDWSFFDGLFMAVITLSTIGYGETHDLSTLGRAYTIVLILVGCGLLAYAFSTLTAYTVGGDLTNSLRRFKMNNVIRKLRNHFLICGDGDTGRYVIEEMQKTHRQFVVVEKDQAKVALLREQNILHVEGDATIDAVLLTAGIEHAHGLISALHTDADNLFVVLTAKGLNPNLRIVSKGVEVENQLKIRRVGADSVVMSNHIGGMRMVSEMIRPGVVSFLDTMLRDKDRTVRVEEIPILPGSKAENQTIEAIGILTQEDFSVVALSRPNQSNRFNPPPSWRLLDGDRIIVMGLSQAIEEFKTKIAPD